MKDWSHVEDPVVLRGYGDRWQQVEDKGEPGWLAVPGGFEAVCLVLMWPAVGAAESR